MNPKEEFISIYQQFVKREGADKLLEYLKKSDFFYAPASAKFHCACREGLLIHSLNTYKRLLKLVRAEHGDAYANTYSDETLAICGLLHDVCKTDYYVEDIRNAKVNGRWEEVTYYRVDDKLPYGHGEKSVYIINGFLRLTREEAMAINWHMGGFDDRAKSNSYIVSEVYNRYTLALLLSTADVLATFIDEKRD